MPSEQDRTADLLKKVRNIEIKTRGLSDQLFSGGYHSAFKGRGMSFSEVRGYQYGDDVRAIDWNVTARLDDTFVKVFEEEREITVMLVVDISASTLFGTQLSKEGEPAFKQDIITELCALLAFSASNNNDKVGAVLFSETVQTYLPPKKGRNHILRIIRELLAAPALTQGTDLADVLRHLSNVLKKRSIVFIISDFIQTGPEYRDELSLLRKRHDVVGIQVFDQREAEMPDLGLVHVRDAETGELAWIDTSHRQTRLEYEAWFRSNQAQAKERFLRSGADFLSISTRESYVQALMGLFARRGKRR
jgi:uncharacterized protein (DUF58 family)